MFSSQLFLLCLTAAGTAVSGRRQEILAGRQDLPLVNSAALQDAITEESLSLGTQMLQTIADNSPNKDGVGNRDSGSPGHLETLALIEKYLEAVPDYYTTTVQQFTFPKFEATANITIQGVQYESYPFIYSNSTSISGKIVAIANSGCNRIDYPAEVKDNIALIATSSCTRKSLDLFHEANAAAVITYYDGVAKYLGQISHEQPASDEFSVPVVGLNQMDALAILDAINQEAATEGTIDIVSVVEDVTTSNIIAETVGGDHDNVLVVGAHTDSESVGPGINDDGSGVIGILETALQLTNYSTNNAVRFGFWAAEEKGLLGSNVYTTLLSAEEAAKIRLYLNFDMIASPNFRYGVLSGDDVSSQVVPTGSSEVEAFFAKYFAELDIPTAKDSLSGGSDYVGFIDIGVPVGGLSTGAGQVKTEEEAEQFGGEADVAYDANYHTSDDTYENLNMTAFLVNAKAIAAAVAHYGTSFDDLPQRERGEASESRC